MQVGSWLAAWYTRSTTAHRATGPVRPCYSNLEWAVSPLRLKIPSTSKRWTMVRTCPSVRHPTCTPLNALTVVLAMDSYILGLHVLASPPTTQWSTSHRHRHRSTARQPRGLYMMPLSTAAKSGFGSGWVEWGLREGIGSAGIPLKFSENCRWNSCVKHYDRLKTALSVPVYHRDEWEPNFSIGLVQIS